MKVKKNKYPREKATPLDKPFISRASLDYHEMGILSRYDIERIYENFINDSYSRGYDSVVIVTGKGNVVRPLVQKFLAKDKRIKEFSYADYFNGGSGVIEICLY